MNPYLLNLKARDHQNSSNQKTNIAAMKVTTLILPLCYVSFLLRLFVMVILHYYFNKFIILGSDGYVAFQVEGDPAPTVEWFKVNSFLNAVKLIRYDKVT